MLNGTAVLFGAAYHTRGCYSRLLSFTGYLAPYFDHLPFDPTIVLARVDKLIEEWTCVSEPITQASALQLLIKHELTQIRDVLNSESFLLALQAEFAIEESLNLCLDQGISLIRRLGLSVERPKLFVVDSIPAPYDAADYKAVATDEDDLLQHGITPGIYIVRGHLRPFYSRALLLHELIHPLAAEIKPDLLGRGLEEGLAEVLGSMYLTGKVLGPALAREIFVYNRLRFGFDQFWDLYLDYTRQAVYVYNRFGLDGLVSIIAGGRPRIKEVETLLLQGRLSEIALPAGHWDDDLSELANFVSLTYCRNLVVSPLAKYLLPFVSAGRTVKSILEDARVEREEGLAAIRELQSRVIIAVVSEDLLRVTLSDTKMLHDNMLVRFQIPE